jgi:hypothetical protein
MTDVLRVPEDGSTWLGDAAIDTDKFLTALGQDLTTELADWTERQERAYPEWDGGEQKSEDAIIAYLSDLTGRDYVVGRSGRDNVYNNEQDFSAVFTYTVYVPVGSEDDWLYADDVFVAACIHLGGDVRGSYGGVQLFRADDLADAGFFDWTVGWSVAEERRTLAAETHPWLGGGERITRQLEDERVERGYSSHPTSELEKHYGDQGRWKDGAFLFTDSDDAPTGTIAIPYAYVEGGR